jgi:hypothetical protein
VEVDEGQETAAYVPIVCETDAGYVELRLYGSDPFERPSYWIGMFDTAGVLQRTWISDDVDLNAPDVQRWLRPIVGYQLAARLARMALARRARSGEDGDGTRVVRLSGRGAAKAS